MKEFWKEFKMYQYYMSKSRKYRVNKKSKILTKNLRRKQSRKQSRKLSRKQSRKQSRKYKR